MNDGRHGAAGQPRPRQSATARNVQALGSDAPSRVKTQDKRVSTAAAPTLRHQCIQCMDAVCRHEPLTLETVQVLGAAWGSSEADRLTGYHRATARAHRAGGTRTNDTI